MKINVVDDICGSGKTSWAIQRINERTANEKFIYVTPFLNEVQRIINSTNIEFLEPESAKGKGSKIAHFKELLNSNDSIVTTHQLFRMFDSEILETIKDAGYILIMDEVASVLEQIPISQREIQYLLKAEAIEVKDDGSVIWKDENYGSDIEDKRFYDIRMLAQSDNLFIHENIAMFWTMNIKSFTSFKEVYILTYLFDGQIQKYYYDIHNAEYDKFSVKKLENGRYEIIEYDKYKEPRQEIYAKLNIYEDYVIGKRVSKLNSNYLKNGTSEKKKRAVFSSTWFEKATAEEIKQVRSNLRNYFANQVSTENKNIFWTTRKSFAPDLKNQKCTFNKKDDRTKDNFVSLNTRATNDYAHCTSMAYIYNRFMKPMEKKFFMSRGKVVNENMLAVSDLIQFMFRGCIRKGEPMNCYIPSERMRKMLKDWSEFKN